MDEATKAAMSKRSILPQSDFVLTSDCTAARLDKAEDIQGWKTLQEGIATHMVAAFDPSIAGECRRTSFRQNNSANTSRP